MSIGEIIVQGIVVTKEYMNLARTNKLAKIADKNGSFWHRMGDVGYIDD